MRAFIRPIATVSSISALSLALLCGSNGLAAAQPAPAGQLAASEAPGLKQVALTDKQVEGLLSAQKEMAAATAKLPDQQSDKPDPKVEAELDAIAKKYGFSNYAEYDNVVSNIGLVMVGFDPQTKTYVGPDVVIKKQIETLKADKEVPPLDKKKALTELQESLKTTTPVQYPDNIKLVAKYYDKLSEAMQED